MAALVGSLVSCGLPTGSMSEPFGVPKETLLEESNSAFTQRPGRSQSCTHMAVSP